MRSHLLLAALALAALFQGCGGGNGQVEDDKDTVTVVVHDTVRLAPDPASRTGFLDAPTVMTLLGRKGTWGLRVYNARRDAADAEGTVLAVGIDGADGSEITVPLPELSYRLHEKLDGDHSIERKLERNDAVKAVTWIADAKLPVHCAEFRKDELERLLLVKEATAIRFDPVLLYAGEEYHFTFAAVPVQIVDGVAKRVGDGAGLLDTEPCPVVCGPVAHYLRDMDPAR